MVCFGKFAGFFALLLGLALLPLCGAAQGKNATKAIHVAEEPNRLSSGTLGKYAGPWISINYRNGDVRTLLRLLADRGAPDAVARQKSARWRAVWCRGKNAAAFPFA
jgi:hypothetical protein